MLTIDLHWQGKHPRLVLFGTGQSLCLPCSGLQVLFSARSPVNEDGLRSAFATTNDVHRTIAIQVDEDSIFW